jgi:hypothetical protein
MYLGVQVRYIRLASATQGDHGLGNRTIPTQAVLNQIDSVRDIDTPAKQQCFGRSASLSLLPGGSELARCSFSWRSMRHTLQGRLAGELT